MAQSIGYLIYLAVAGCMIVTTVHIRFLEGRTWDNVSVRCGLLLVKAAMLVGGKFGPLIYFCMLLQIYNFALIINRRRDSQPGATLALQIFFAFFTMHIYFLRSGHRERMSTIQVGAVCPGGIMCPDSVHTSLLVLDLFAPFFIGHLCLPLTVRARIQHAYAHLLPPSPADDLDPTHINKATADTTSKKGK